MSDEDILDHMEHAYEQTGYKPTPKIYVREGSKQACPLGAVCENSVPLYRSSKRSLAARILGKTEEWCRGFESGFDGLDTSIHEIGFGEEWTDGHRLGEKARERFLKEQAIET